MANPESELTGRDAFPSTCWTQVVNAAGQPDSPQAREALAELCRFYWYPIYALIRRTARGPDEARDLTQDFFAHLLEKGTVAAADRTRGRFRAFLRRDCEFFLSHRREGDRALKRGGGRPLISIDVRDAEGRYLSEPADELTPELLFDRSWSMSLLEATLGRLEREYVDSGRGRQFECLQVVLTDGARSIPYAKLAEQIGTTIGGVQQAVRRMRKRYQTLLRGEIATTLDHPSDEAIDDEIRCLFRTLGP
jgi:RNA polymerase sigma-70 factor (ECF subfamily)